MKYLFKILILFSFTKVCCQQSNYLAIYDNYVGIENLNLYHGKVFIPQILTVKNHHPFLNVNFNEGQVFYDNQLYVSALKYDIYNDIVILKLPQQEKSLSFSLNSKLVTEFNFNHRTFVKLPKKEVLLSFYKNGFFERIHKGRNIDFYIKHLST